LVDGKNRPGGVDNEEDDDDWEELELPGQTDGGKDCSKGDNDGGLYLHKGGDVLFSDGFHEQEVEDDDLGKGEDHTGVLDGGDNRTVSDGVDGVD